MVRIARGEELVDSAMQVIANAVTIEQLRQAQAVVLPLEFAICDEFGANRGGDGPISGLVCKQRNRFIQGRAVGDGTVAARGVRSAAQAKFHFGRRDCCTQAVFGASPRGRYFGDRSNQA